LADATVARACVQSDSSYAVRAKREIGKLWEDIDKPPYKVLFNSGIPGPTIWKLVQTLRTIEDELKSLGRSSEGRDKLFAIHGNRFIAHLVFGHLQQDLREEEIKVSDGYKERVVKETNQANVYSAI
jgi:hypothetical protein